MFPVGGLIKKAKAMIPKSVTAAAKTVVKKVADSATKIINRFEKNTSAATKALASIPAKVNATAKKAQAITQKVAAAVPKVIDAAKAAGKKQLDKIAEVNNVIKTSILTKAIEINSKNLRILDKLGQEAQNSLDRIHKGTGTLGAFYALNPNRTLYVGVDFLLTARETIIEEYPILNIGTEYSKNFISYMENQAKNLNDTIGSSVYNANIPIISDTVGAFTGQRDPNAESNIASMTGAFYRGLYVKGVGGTVDALANLAADPFEAIKGLNSIALEPEVMLPGLASLATEFVDKKIIHGSAEDRSEVAGQAVFEIAQFFIGTGEVKATTKIAEIGADAAKTSKALNLTTKANKLIKTEKLLNSTVFKGIKQTLSTTAKNSGCKAIESIDSMRLLFRNSSPNLALSYAGIGRLDDFVGTGELLQKGLSKIKSMASEIPVPKGVNIKGPKVSGKGVEEGAEKAVKVAGDGKEMPDFGNKLDYLFGKAKGNQHNLERTAGMESELANKMGIADTPANREYIMQKLNEAYLDDSCISSIEQMSYIAKELPGKPTVNWTGTTRETFIMGPDRGAVLQTLWDDNILKNIIVRGGKGAKPQTIEELLIQIEKQ